MALKEKDTEKKAINTQQVAVARASMRKVKIYAANKSMTIGSVIDLAINNLCGDIQVTGGQTGE